jgi:hypothetical protein
MKIIYQGKVDNNGQLIIHNRKAFDKDLQSLIDLDVNLTVNKRKKKRSNPQNAYYWGVVVPLIREGLNGVGYDVSKDETHDLIKYRFARRSLVNKDTGEVIETTGSTTEMDTFDFSKFIEKIQIWSVEYLNVVIPSPNEELEIEFEC